MWGQKFFYHIFSNLWNTNYVIWSISERDGKELYMKRIFMKRNKVSLKGGELLGKYWIAWRIFLYSVKVMVLFVIPVNN